MNPLTQFKKISILPLLIALALVALASPAVALGEESNLNQVLEWNQIFIDTLIATNTPNSSSQRLGAIVHTAIFDAYNGIERRYTPVFVPQSAPSGASRRAAVIAAAHTALVGLFPSQQPALDASYAASLAALSDDGEDGGQSRERGIAWGTRGGAGSARLARDRWVQRELPSVHRWNCDRPVAANTAGVRTDERAGVGIHRDVRPESTTPSSSLDHREV